MLVKAHCSETLQIALRFFFVEELGLKQPKVSVLSASQNLASRSGNVRLQYPSQPNRTIIAKETGSRTTDLELHRSGHHDADGSTVWTRVQGEASDGL